MQGAEGTGEKRSATCGPIYTSPANRTVRFPICKLNQIGQCDSTGQWHPIYKNLIGQHIFFDLETTHCFIGYHCLVLSAVATRCLIAQPELGGFRSPLYGMELWPYLNLKQSSINLDAYVDQDT